MHDHGWIDDALGETVCPGDFVITNTNGTHSTCNPVVFHLNYEAVEEPDSAPAVREETG